jgi:hypothetical protein
MLRGADGVPPGCNAAVDSEQHVLFKCLASEHARSQFWEELGLAVCDMGEAWGLQWTTIHKQYSSLESIVS